MKKSKSSIAITAAALVFLMTTSCSKLSGTYECGYGQKLIFDGGKMKTQSGMVGVSVETPYNLDGNEVKIEQNGVSSTLYTLDANGCLIGAGGMAKCCKSGDMSENKSQSDESTGNTAGAENNEKPTESNGTPTTEEKDKAAESTKRIQDSISAAIANSMGQ